MTSAQRTTSIVLGIAVIALAGGIAFAQNQNRMKASLMPASGNTSVKPDTGSTEKTYTLNDIATHKDKTSCWTTINGGVYDVTSWISQHPGGPEPILSLCGNDGSAAFNGQHGKEPQPATELAGFKIGILATGQPTGKE